MHYMFSGEVGRSTNGPGNPFAATRILLLVTLLQLILVPVMLVQMLMELLLLVLLF